MSYTPLTDAAVLPPSCYWEREIKVVPADFAHSLERANRELREALESARGYLMNAKIDLETGAKKATAIGTIDGGIRTVEAALARVKQA